MLQSLQQCATMNPPLDDSSTGIIVRLCKYVHHGFHHPYPTWQRTLQAANHIDDAVPYLYLYGAKSPV